jgi:cytochrome c biogenesis protein CcdA
MNYKKIYFTPPESSGIYGGDEKYRSLIPNRKGGIKAPSFLIGFALICILGAFLIYNFVYGQMAIALRKLIVFHSPACHRCAEIKNEVMPDIENEFRGSVEIEYRDISDIENYKLLLSLKEKYKSKIALDLPVLFFEGEFLNGRQDVRNRLSALITKSLIKSRKEEALPSMDLIRRFNTFTPIAIISAGLIDGINPCAFTVIVFFISFLTLQGYRRKELIAIGICFIFSVFLTYLLIGLGIFNFLYQLKGFWFIARITNISIGIFSIILGLLAVYDFFKFKKTQTTEGLFLQLPQSVKNRIHYVIGLHYRKAQQLGPQGLKLQRHIFKLVITALFTGFLVSILEAICTGQTYLPTITFILKTTGLKLQASGYLLLYNLMFIVPLLIIFFFALLGATSEQFARFLKRRLLTIKLLMAVLFFALGVFLIWRA